MMDRADNGWYGIYVLLGTSYGDSFNLIIMLCKIVLVANRDFPKFGNVPCPIFGHFDKCT